MGVRRPSRARRDQVIEVFLSVRQTKVGEFETRKVPVLDKMDLVASCYWSYVLRLR